MMASLSAFEDFCGSSFWIFAFLQAWFEPVFKDQRQDSTEAWWVDFPFPLIDFYFVLWQIFLQVRHSTTMTLTTRRRKNFSATTSRRSSSSGKSRRETEGSCGRFAIGRRQFWGTCIFPPQVNHHPGGCSIFFTPMEYFRIGFKHQQGEWDLF